VPCVKAEQRPALPASRLTPEILAKAKEAIVLLARDPPASNEEQGAAVDALIAVMYGLDADLAALWQYALAVDPLLAGCMEVKGD